MNIIVVIGSHRQQSQSRKVGLFLCRLLKGLTAEMRVDLLDLAMSPIPFWDEQGNAEIWTPISDRLQAAEGIIVVTPEWGGMVPPALKNFFLHCSNDELAHKPGLIVAVSAGRGGAYPVAELRMSSYKNTRLCYIPDHVIVRNVQTMLNDFERSASQEEEALRARLQYALYVFLEYCKGLRSVRQSDAMTCKKYPFGM